MDSLFAIVVEVIPASRVDVPIRKKQGRKPQPIILAHIIVSTCFEYRLILSIFIWCRMPVIEQTT